MGEGRVGKVVGSRILTLGMLLSLLVPFAPDQAEATDYASVIHWHGRRVEYHIATSVPSGWRASVRAAAAQWTNSARLRMPYGGITTSSDPNVTSTHIVWRGQIPQNWQDGCDPAVTVACTRYSYTGTSTLHLVDTDFVYNRDFAFTTNDLECFFPGEPFDVETVALHEFGHWGVLQHSPRVEDTMYEAVVICDRTLSQHDIDTMNYVYRNH